VPVPQGRSQVREREAMAHHDEESSHHLIVAGAWAPASLCSR
jgi:hypothetical protein